MPAQPLNAPSQVVIRIPAKATDGVLKPSTAVAKPVPVPPPPPTYVPNSGPAPVPTATANLRVSLKGADGDFVKTTYHYKAYGEK
jgi:hypothetical protein